MPVLLASANGGAIPLALPQRPADWPGAWRHASGDRTAGRVARGWLLSQFGSAAASGFSHTDDVTFSATSHPPPDFEIVARLIAGDERALGLLYDRHGGMAFSLASAIVADSSDAEEVVADAFAQIWRSAASFDAARGSVIAWISTIVRTRALDLLRSRRRRARVLDEAAIMSDEWTTSAHSTGAPAPDRQVEQHEAATRVRQALGDLPAPQRMVLELAYFGGLSQSEIAAHLSEPLGTVKTRMRAGMEKLRTSLKPLMEGRA